MSRIEFSGMEQKSKLQVVRMGLYQLIIAALMVFASSAFAINMTDVQFNTLPDGKVLMKFDFDGQVPEPKVYAIESPARIALDLDGVSSSLKQKKHTLGLGNAQSVMVLESGGRTRVIVNLLELDGYETQVEGNVLKVFVGQSSQLSDVSTSEGKKVAKAGSNQSDARVAEITNIDFRRGEKGEARVVIDLSNPNIGVDAGVKGKYINLRFSQAALPEKLRLKYDVSDFATPVQSINADQDGSDTLIQVQPVGEYDYLAYQTDNEYVLTVKPLTKQEIEAKKKEFAYVGDKLSLNFQDIEVRAILQLLADFTDLNLVASDTVGGKITLRLENVPWDQALDLILKTKGLDKRQDGNVLMVAPAAEIAQREQEAIQANKQIEELAPLQTEFIRVRYAKASDIFGLLSGGSGEGEGEGEGVESSAALLSSRATVVVDERTNSLLVTETAVKLEELRRLISLIDVPIKQVMIEARIVTATTDVSEKMGIQWGGAGAATSGGNRASVFGSQEGFLDFQKDEDTFSYTNIVDLGVNDVGATNINIGLLDGDRFPFLDLQLSAIESSGEGEVVSQPKLITGDKQKAIIKSGQQIAYEESSANGGTTAVFKDVALVLDVTPSITPDENVIMDIKLNQDSVAGFTPNGVPIIDTTSIETQVLVANGETVVLGGIFQMEETRGVTKTPFLGDIPYLGRLFRRDIESTAKTEILLFITPRILADTLVQ